MKTMFLLVSFLALGTLLSGCTEQPATPITGTPCTDLIAQGDGTNPAHTRVLFDTSRGQFRAELFDDKTPITVQNFKKLVGDGFFTNLLFHRIIKDFMIQTGGMQTDGEFKESPYEQIHNEARASGCPNIEFTLSMARTSTGPEYGADTATNQFFVNTDDNRASLDPGSYAQNPGGYAVFGVVYEGRDIVELIENTPVTRYSDPGANPHCQTDSSPSCPREDVILRSITVI